MPETACLHIQAHGSGPVRVVDLRGGPIRIGRAAYCDVRIADPDLADEECRLRRRGGTWQLVPIAGRDSVRLDGRLVAGPSTLAFGTTFVLGAHRLTLQPSATSSPWLDHPVSAPPNVESVKEGPGSELTAAYRADWQSDTDSHERRERAQRETKRWESRSRAAGEKLRSSAMATMPVQAPARPEAPTVETRAIPRPDMRPAGGIALDPGVKKTAPGWQGSVPQPRYATDALMRADSGVELPTPATRRGYVSPEAPNARRAPVRLSNWARSSAPKQPAPPEPARGNPIESTASASVAVATLVEPLPTAENNKHDHITTMEFVDSETSVAEECALPDSGPSAVERAVLDAEASVSDLGVPRGEHVDLTTTEFEALLCRLQTMILAETPPAPVEVEPASSVVAGVLTAEPAPEVDFLPGRAEAEDEDEDREHEPETTRPLLGAARQVAQVNLSDWRAEPSSPDSETPSDETPRWVEPRPDEANDHSESAVWEYHTPFVTDTNLARPENEVEAVPLTSVDSSGRASRGPDSLCEWPTFRDILSAQGARPHAAATVMAARGPSKARKHRPEPTAAKEPGQWRLPLWLGWLPTSAAAIGVGVAGLTGAWAWSVDGYNAGLVAQRLAQVEPSKMRLPDGVAPTEGSWWATSATHLVQWAAYRDRNGGDPSQAEEARVLLDRAAGVGPLNPTVRYALARPTRVDSSAAPALALSRSLGQSRDVPALAWAGRNLLAAGKKESALRAFRAALEMAAQADLTRPIVPAFLDDSRFRRYALPNEDALGAVIREMASPSTWTYKDWAGALPRGTAAAVIAARVLRESSSPDAETALDAALAEADSVPALASTTAEAVRLAAGAEAMAMKQRWADARDRYRQAVDLMPIEPVRRAWWFNLADLSARLADETERQNALEAAKVADLNDEITRRIVDLQRESGAVARRPGGRVTGASLTDSEARR